MTKEGGTGASKVRARPFLQSQANVMAMVPILKRAVRTKTGRTEVATEILPRRDALDNFPSCSSSLKKLSTPTFPMTRMEDIAEKRLLVVHVPEVK